MQTARVTFGRTVLFGAGTATASMGAYHFLLPTHMQWRAGMLDVPGMITWGLFAINFDLSVALVLFGLLACLQAVARAPRTLPERFALFVPALFWLAHQIWVRTHAMPIPGSLRGLLLTLEGFGFAAFVAHAIGARMVSIAEPDSPAHRPGRVVFIGGAAGLAAIASVLLVITSSMATLKPKELALQDAASRGAAAEVDSDRSPMVADAELPTLAELTEGRGARTLAQPTDITSEQYCAAWPELESVLAAPRSSEPPAEDPALLNLFAQDARQRGDWTAAEAAITRALALEPDRALHHLQAAFLAYARLDAERVPLARWALSNRAQRGFERALELDPSLHAARLYVAYTYGRAPVGFGGDPARALDLLDQAVVAGESQFLPVRALFRLEQGQREAGLADAERAMRLGHYHTGTFERASAAALEAAQESGEGAERALAFATFAWRVGGQTADAWGCVQRAMTADKE